MTNLFEAAAELMKSFVHGSGDKQPMHVGEVMHCWAYLASVGDANNYVKMGLNTTKDEDLRSILADSLKTCESQRKRLTEVLLSEGVPLPPLSEMKPDCNPDDIPQGVKQTDNEIANGISIKVAISIVDCATGIAQSIRPDVGLLWASFQEEHMKLAAAIRPLLSKRGWLKQPPFYVPPGSPVQ
ncbi:MULTISPECIES: DUF3231 family protein [Paenibacillus]|uniref:DUF3231 family protein n=1 Tax=Paenibacillus TaxID=44249 RepID=UPI0022B88FDB|nr:DUF3231 family protein [Paenibacillus caseinilyticus]MCZ8521280.1 DUF3231 family protein [Paenibacillus caseinilyticus]